MGNPRVLWIDDEPDLIESAMTWLRTTGVQIDQAHSVRLALDAVKSAGQTYCCIILDLMMDSDDPAIPYSRTEQGTETGFVLQELIHAQLPETPIIVFTNYTTQRKLDSLVASGVTCLKKNSTRKLIQEVLSVVEPA